MAGAHEQVEWLKSIFDESANLVFINQGGRVVYANRRSIELTGFTLDELTSPEFDFMQLVAPECRELVEQAYIRHQRGEEVEPYEYVFVNRHGERIEAVNATSIIEFDGRPAILGTVTDISALKRIERELSASEELHRTVLETCPDAIFYADLKGNVVVANEAAAQLRGYADVETLLREGKNLLESVLPEERESAAQAIAETLTGGGQHRYEFNILDATQTRIIPIEIMASLVRDPDGVATGFVGVSRDLTERRAAEAERHRLEAQIQHTQRLESLGVLAGGIAHDFNNLLVGVLGNASLAMGQVSAESEARGSLGQIVAAAQRATILIEQMLTYSGRGGLTRQPLRLPELVAAMAHLLEAAIPKGISLEYDFAENTPPISGDSGQLQQVAMNLIINAAEAMQETGGVVGIRIATAAADEVVSVPGLEVAAPAVPEDEFVVLSVEDQGVGMDELTRGRIFEPFFSTKFTGRGLGLAAVIGIVRGHEGALAVNTELGRGTRFTVYLPAHPVEAPFEVVPEGLPVEAVSGTARVLVVDDEELVRNLAGRALENAGYSVVTACDGVEAVAAVGEEPFDIVVLDLTMPRMGGVEALAALHDLRPGLPVILSSGYSERDAQERGGADGVAAFVQKPYLPETLVATVARVLRAVDQGG